MVVCLGFMMPKLNFGGVHGVLGKNHFGTTTVAGLGSKLPGRDLEPPVRPPGAQFIWPSLKRSWPSAEEVYSLALGVENARVGALELPDILSCPSNFKRKGILSGWRGPASW